MVVKQGVWYGSQDSDGDEGLRHTKSKKMKVESEGGFRYTKSKKTEAESEGL